MLDASELTEWLRRLTVTQGAGVGENLVLLPWQRRLLARVS